MEFAHKSAPRKKTAIKKNLLVAMLTQLNAVVCTRYSRGLLAPDELVCILPCVRFAWPWYLAVDIFIRRT